MTRPLRIEYPGALYHVTSRGNRRESIYLDIKDRSAFLSILEEVVKRFKWICHAYCLMNNHYHLIIETQEANLSRGMRQLNGVYTQKFNSFHNKLGHVFQGRFKAILVEHDSHLLELTRYVVLNPVRAAMVASPGRWPWSSYLATAGYRKPPAFLFMDWILPQFHKNRATAQKLYRKFVSEGYNAPSPWKDLSGGIFLGPESFIARCARFLSSSANFSEIPVHQRRAARPSLEKLFQGIDMKDRDSRNSVIRSSYLDHGYCMREIAAFLGVHYATISRAVNCQKKEMLECKT